MRLGETELLAKMISTIEDPHNVGVGIENLTEEDEGGIHAVVHLPSGDRYAVTIKWLGDSEDATA